MHGFRHFESGNVKVAALWSEGHEFKSRNSRTSTLPRSHTVGASCIGSPFRPFELLKLKHAYSYQKQGSVSSGYYIYKWNEYFKLCCCMTWLWYQLKLKIIFYCGYSFDFFKGLVRRKLDWKRFLGTFHKRQHILRALYVLYY